MVVCVFSCHDPAVTASGWWPKLKAVQAGRVALVDGNQMFNRPGERLTGRTQLLASSQCPWLEEMVC
jgi:ABC-type Fe3+-hydroxamate transport system substrate-binding protein